MNDLISKKKTVKRDSSLHAYHRERMKNRFLRDGLNSFEEHEVLELLLFFALPQVDTNEIAHRLINKAGSFTNVFNLSFEELKTVDGIKDHAATFLKLIPQISRYYAMHESKHILSPKIKYEELAKMCVTAHIGTTNETLMAFYFDASMHFLDSKVISVGSLQKVSSNVRVIVEDMVKLSAVNCMLSHNHPTASILPSLDDCTATRRIQSIFKDFELNLIEHFIISGDTYLGILKFNEEYGGMMEAEVMKYSGDSSGLDDFYKRYPPKSSKKPRNIKQK